MSPTNTDTKTLADKPQVQLFEMVDRLARTSVVTGEGQALQRYSFVQTCFLSEAEIDLRVAALKKLSSEEYHQQVIAPLETGDRGSVIKLVHALAEEVHQEFKQGPLYVAEVTILSDEGQVRCGIIAQNRLENKGVWMPEHHRKAGEWARRMEQARLPVVTFIDTPGADAGALANQQNQAHSISALIATMADLAVPTVGIVLGAGYSGGAIPLATTNVLLSMRDGLFNTIQPQGLAAIARKQKLDWKSCAQLVGVSACELQQEGVIDAVIDYSPVNADRTVRRLRQAILVAVESIQQKASTLVGEEALAAFYQLDARRLAAEAEGEGSSRRLQSRSVQDFPSLFGVAFRVLRSLTLRSRIKVADDADLLDQVEEITPARTALPAGQSNANLRFKEWLERKDKLVYEEDIFRCWQKYREATEQLGEDRGYLASLLFGEPQDNHDKALNELCAEISFNLYNRWQRDAQENLSALIQYLGQQEIRVDASQIPNDQVTLMDILRDDKFIPLMLEHCYQLKQFDAIYEKVLDQLVYFVSELSDRKRLSSSFMEGLLDQAGLASGDARETFSRWLGLVKRATGFRSFLYTAEQWKKQQHPRLSTVAFVVASYVFDKLLPEFFQAKREHKIFSGHFQPVSIGRRKDFWNQLQQATIDLRIQEVLNQAKPADLFQPQDLLERFFRDFLELDANLTTANPRRFPGFGATIAKQREKQQPTAGLITGTAKVNGQAVGVFVSNHGFQAGAFDMASAERLCRLLAHCGRKGMPVIGLVCSGGMQTKEGASALFSMAVVNDHINRFVMELQLPLMIIGYGDCTGGAQASLVTHPLVDTYYFSGTNMPFAGRIVVPDYLPVTATLSNYLVKTPGAMHGLVQHPFMPDLDDRLRAIDPRIDIASVSVEELIENWLQGRVQWTGVQTEETAEGEELLDLNFRPFEKVLVHARGCTAVKLIREAQAMNLKVVLVQSDPDMDSVAAESLGENDQLVCLGGYTSEESYLNGDSVLRIAELTGAEALHPGIGFLSENHRFAQSCLARNLVFVGPSPASMSSMGDKAQAIHTAMAAGVPVVPGSHGILRDVQHAHEVADQIGYPVILKAAYGGGGKGILEVHRREDMEESFLRIQAEGRNSFGRDEIYLERLVTRFRHIEVQVLRDKFGCTQILGIRDCSVQRNKQKILEESASTLLPPELERVARVSAASLAEACNYVGAGTVEFIFDLDHQQLYFMEMNTRLQVEHPVTELVSGVDIVREQFRVAMGKSIDHLQAGHKGYAIEARINAERVSVDAEGRLQVAPTPGQVTRCEFPEREGITQILCVGEGKSVPPFYDNLVAQIIAYGQDRADAIRKLREFLQDVRIEGIDTNVPLLVAILGDEPFVQGNFDTSYLKSFGQRKRELFDGQAAADRAGAGEAQIQVEGTDELKVLAPSSSILYRAASPSQPDYVKVGDIISADQTLCLLEVMKLFQPLSLSSFNRNGRELYPADQEYQVVHIKGMDGQHVNQGDLLFIVKPVVKVAVAV